MKKIFTRRKLTITKQVYCSFSRHCLLLFLFAFVLVTQLCAQDNPEKQLSLQFKNAQNDSDRIMALQQLSNYYYARREETKGDSIVEKQLMIAYESGNQNWIRKTLFENAGLSFTGNSTMMRNEKTRAHIKKALAFAKAGNLKDYEALAWGLQAKQELQEGKINEALQTAQFALATAINTENDSAKVTCQIMVGKVYLQKVDMLMAYKSFTNAQDIAEKSKNKFLKTLVELAYIFMYRNKLNKYDIARKYALEAVETAKKNTDARQLINIYIELGKILEGQPAREYLLKAGSLADSIHDYAGKIEAQRILFFYMVTQDKPGLTFTYLQDHPDLQEWFENTGPDYMNYMKATVFSYAGLVDSSLYYFQKAENSFKTMYDPAGKKEFFKEYVICLLNKPDSLRAIPYAEQLFQYSKDNADIKYMLYAGNILQNLYEKKGNFTQAYRYSVSNSMYKDSLLHLGRDKDMALMEIDNLNKKRLADEEMERQRTERRHNLQYMAITIIIASIFVLMIFIGMFKVSTITIRAMGFFSMIFLFEFIILILDNYIHHLTHGEPWKVWLIKIGIISVILPLHHYIEEKLIHYLLSKKLILLRSRFNTFRLKWNKRKPIPEEIPGAVEPDEEIPPGDV
jgi:tetratricopeptide (TPR) repeat protein